MRTLSLLILAALGLALGFQDAAAQQRTVTGRVTAEDTGAPIAAAQVGLLGTTRSVQTDAQGNFRISVPQGEVQLRIQNFGYRARDVTVAAGQSSVQVALPVDVLNLEGIVVTGQSTTVQRRNLANAVASIPAEQVGGAPSSETVEKMLQGKVAGSNIEQNSGAPGGGVQLRLRGVSTIIGESEPLWVVDGVVMSNVAIPSNANAVTQAAGGSNPSLTQDAVVNRAVDLNPHDIERIEILKGPSAAALYGSRAANGVILVTTKSGQPGDVRVSVTQRFGTFDTSEKLGFREWTRDEAIATFDDPSLASYFNADGTPIKRSDHEELLAGENDVSFETVATVSGGDQDTRYFLSGTWKEDNGVIPNTGFEKQALRINLEQQLGDRLRVSANTNLLRTLAARGVTNNDNAGVSYYMVLPFTPDFVDLTRQEDGTFPDNPFERSNPLETAALASNDEEVWRFIASGNVDFEFLNTGTHRLQLLATGGVDFFSQENDLLFPPTLQFEPSDGLPGTSLLSNSENTDITLSANLVHTFRSDRGYSATTTTGVQYEDRELNISRVSSFGLTAGQPNIDAGVQQTLREQRSLIRDLGFFGQEEVLLMDERLLLTLGLRADRTSVNADPDDFFFYPKAAASYRFDNLTSYLDAFKLRMAWGQVGNQPLYGQKFTPLTATTNVNGIPALVVQGTTGSEDLTPERQSEIELGFDATLMDGTAQFEATAFQKNVEDLLLQRTPAPSTGFATQVFNGGELRVRGLELALTATPIQSDRFSWISRTTYYRDYSEITSLPVPAFETGGFGTSLGAFRIEEGASATQIVANAGLDENGEQIVRKVGDANPTFRMGFSNDFTFGDFSVGSLFDWSEGNSVINLTQFLVDAGANAEDWSDNTREITLPDGTTEVAGDGEARLLIQGAGDTRPYIEDASYIKLRELSLSWNVPTELLGGVLGGRVESASLTLSGRNLLTFTDYTGLDPEVSNFGNQPIARNIDVAPFPPSRSYWLSVNVTF